MRDHRTTAELERLVGKERAQSTPRAIVKAERELALRGAGEEALFERKLMRAGAIAAGAGAFCVMWAGLLLIAFGVAGGSPPTSAGRFPGIFAWFDLIFVGTGLLQTACGVLLVVGGLGTRSRRRFGPNLICIALGIGIIYCVVFTVALAASAASSGGPGAFQLVFAAFSVLNAAFWVFMLWLPIRFFASARVREACASGVVA